jgi:hypothetical protein
VPQIAGTVRRRGRRYGDRVGLGDGQSEAFGARTPDGRWWWNGYLWRVVPDAFAERPPREWPPPGYYRRPPVGRLTRWNGTSWGRVYWRWWRIAATLAVLIIGGLATLTFMGAMLSDPGPGGDTPAFEHTKALGANLFLLCVAATFLLLWLLNRPALRSPVKPPRRAKGSVEP